jgi:hypothetical protein
MKTAAPAVWLTFLFCVYAPAADVALVAGIGNVRYALPEEGAEDSEMPRWGTWSRPEARMHAESVFRVLVPDAQREPHLYTRSPRWYNPLSSGYQPAVLFTDGIADNDYIPLAPLLMNETRQLGSRVKRDDDVLFFFSGFGRADGWNSTLYDRFREPMALEDLVSGLPPASGKARRLFCLRLFPPGSKEPPTTLLAGDGTSLDAIRRWTQDAERKITAGRPANAPGTIFPALPPRRDALTPVRLQRIRQALDGTPLLRGNLELMDLEQVLDSRLQAFEVQVVVTEKKIFKKIRRPGPLFTIIEEETDELLRMDRNINREEIQQRLDQQQIPTPTARGLVALLEIGSSASFKKTVTFNGVTYQLDFSQSTGLLNISYQD